ncbi:hypothetical protein ACFQ71_05085 [Streptomyces sp. NPDC056534]|uniref:hypothetical protein n=1 Tax=Streptomyces sp. NPDC056534 TaxID=3345857 RepID=UPI0036CA1DBC
MGYDVPELYRTLIDELLVQPEADQEPYYAASGRLRGFSEAIGNDAGEANVCIQRLLSSGSGEAMDALAEHWDKVMHQDVRCVSTAAAHTSTAVTVIADHIAAAKLQIVQVAAECALSTAAELVGGALVFGAADAVVATNVTRAQQSARAVLSGHVKAITSTLSGLVRDPDVAALEGIAAALAGGIGGGAGGREPGAGTGGGTGRAWGRPVPEGGRAVGTGVKVDHAEHERAPRRLREVATLVFGTTSGTLAAAASDHATAAAGGSLAAEIALTLSPVLDDLSRATTAFGDHLSGALPDGVLRISGDQGTTDHGNARRMAQLD